VGGMGEVMMSVCVCSQSSSNQMYKKFTLQNNCIYATLIPGIFASGIRERKTHCTLSLPPWPVTSPIHHHPHAP